VFRKFNELHSAKAVMRELRRHDLPLPVRPLRGPRTSRDFVGAGYERARAPDVAQPGRRRCLCLRPAPN
jgi:hypothetical protein